MLIISTKQWLLRYVFKEGIVIKLQGRRKNISLTLIFKPINDGAEGISNWNRIIYNIHYCS